jgi:5-formyltetrahydrofolate cyclo-ligase
MGLPEMRAARAVMLFVSMEDEADTRPLIRRCLAAGKAVYAPACEPAARGLTPLRLHALEDLRPGFYGILAPPPGETCRPADLDLVLTPARAYDRGGNRLGRGAGYYDRFLAQPGMRALRVGVAFACQVLDAVPHEAHDLPVRILVTEDETIRCDAPPGASA